MPIGKKENEFAINFNKDNHGVSVSSSQKTYDLNENTFQHQQPKQQQTNEQSKV